MKLIATALLLTLTGALAAESAKPFRVLSAEPAPELSALYLRTNGWVGADANYSVPFSSNRTLFFFGDTWIGKVVDNRRTNIVTMINNSVGVLTHGPSPHLDCFWRTNANHKPTAMLLPADGRGFLWPFGGVAVSNTLHLLLHQMEHTKEGGAFGFKTVAPWLATVTNAQEPPDRWRVTQARLPFTELSDTRQLLLGGAMLRHEDFIYTYGHDSHPKDKKAGRHMILARVKTDTMEDFNHWEFFTAGAWQKDFRQATGIASGVPSEFSVTWVSALKKFVFVGNGDLLSPTILARTAPAPWGPWSEPVKLYDCPEVKWNKRVFCYAGKAHPSLSSGDELVISYAANSFSLADVINDARLYWPQLVRVKVAP